MTHLIGKRRLVTIRLIGLAILVATIAATTACGPSLSVGRQTAKDTVVTYGYDAPTRNWVKSVTVIPAPGGKGATPGDGNTLIVQLQSDTPIQEIIFDEGFVAGGADPLFDIDGDPDESGGGAIRIGNLTMDTVDARRLQIRDTQAVSTNMTNVVDQDDELDLNIQMVAVILVQRGASNTLSFKNFRVDRIRILGVGNGVDTHLERLTITRSGVLGRIRIEDAKIDSLILKNVSLEE